MPQETPRYKHYVISLKGSDKRRASIKAQFDKFNIPYEIVDAVRGSELDIPNDPRVDYEAVKREPHWLTPGAIGCSLSHLECMTRAIEDDLDYAIVIEDDAKIVSDYTPYLKTVFDRLKANEIALLFYAAFEPVTLDLSSKVKLDSETDMYYVKAGEPITTTGYIMPRSTCEAMAKAILPVRVSADKWKYFMSINALSRLACVYPNPVDTMDFKSDIMYLDSGWKQKVSNFIDQNRIFPLYQILKEMRKRNKLKLRKTVIA